MIYRIECRFENTEAAGGAARRLRQAVPQIYEIRLRYRSDKSREGVSNNILYTGAVTNSFPTRTVEKNGMFYFRNAAEEEGALEYSEECMLSVIVKDDCRQVCAILVNSGGFDIKTEEESADLPGTVLNKV